jgi:hypothetical protein
LLKAGICQSQCGKADADRREFKGLAGNHWACWTARRAGCLKADNQRAVGGGSEVERQACEPHRCTGVSDKRVQAVAGVGHRNCAVP